jgi:hypothetical protein
MNTVENKLRDALEERADQTAVDTTKLWYGTNRRIQARRAKRWSRLRWVIPAVGVGALTVASAVAVPAWLNAPDRHPSQLTPAATRTVSAKPPAKPSTKPSSKPSSKPPSWQWVFNDRPPAAAMAKARSQSDGSSLVPVDFVRAPDGEFVLVASYTPGSFDQNHPGDVGMCWHNTHVSDGVGGGGCQPAGLPLQDEYTPSDKWLSSGNQVDYPHYGGDGLTSPLKLFLTTGLASNGVARVVGIDDQGHRHEAKLVGKEQGWPNQQYFIVVRQPVELEQIQAYDAAGKLLTSLPAVK